MAARFMLDTNMASYVIKGTYSAVRERLLAVPMASVCISAITEAELLFGVARLANVPRLATAVREFLVRIDRLPWDSAAAESYARLRSGLERRGRPLGSLDLLIAAHALALPAVLVTNDRAFRRVAGLSLADWSRA